MVKLKGIICYRISDILSFSDIFSISSDGEEGREGESRDMFPDGFGGNVDHEGDTDKNRMASQASLYSSKASLSDIYERSEEGEAGDKPRLAGNNTNSSGHSGVSDGGLTSEHTDPCTDQVGLRVELG